MLKYNVFIMTHFICVESLAQMGGPLKSAALFDRTPRTFLRPALVNRRLFYQHTYGRLDCS